MVETELPLVEEAVATMMPAVPAAAGPGAEEAFCYGSWGGSFNADASSPNRRKEFRRSQILQGYS